MSFWKKHWNQAEQIESLTRQGLFLDREKALLEAEVAKLKYERDENAKQVTLERNRRDRDTKAHHQILAQVVGADRKVYVEPKPLEEPKPIAPSEQQLASLRILAQEMLDNDEQNDVQPLTIDGYVDLMLSKGDEYLSILATEN